MTKMSKDKRDKFLLVIIAFGGVVAVLYFLVITDQRAELTELAGKIESLKSKRTSADRTAKRLADAQADLEKQRKILETKQAEMPTPGADSRWFLNMMESRRIKYDLETGDIKGPEAADPGILPKFPFKGVSFHVVLIGTYGNFGRFLADFENTYPYMRVQLLNISPEARVPSSSGPGGLQPLGQVGQSSQTISETEPQKLRFMFRVISLVKTPT